MSGLFVVLYGTLSHISLDVLLTVGGYAHKLEHWQQKRPGIRLDYKLFQFEKGNGETSVDGVWHRHAPGEVVLIPAHRHIQHRSDGFVNLGWIHVRPLSPHLDAMLSHIEHPVVLDYCSDHILPWPQIPTIIRNPQVLSCSEIQLNVTGWLVTALRSVFGDDGPLVLTDPNLTIVRRYIEHHYLDRPVLSDLADLVGWSAGYLQKRFRSVYGYTPYEVIQQYLMADVLEALRTTEKSLEVIASELGFSDRFHLSKAIVRHFGLSASALRR